MSEWNDESRSEPCQPSNHIGIVVPDLKLQPVRPISISSWFLKVGERVIEGDRVVELLFDEVTFDISSPATGRLIAKQNHVDDIVEIGKVVGIIEAEE